MMQESVYCKLLMNSTAQNTMCEVIRKNRPPSGIVQLLTITEKQFAKIEYIVGASSGDVLDTDERLVEL